MAKRKDSNAYQNFSQKQGKIAKKTDNYVGPDKDNPYVQHRVDKTLTPEEIKELLKEDQQFERGKITDNYVGPDKNNPFVQHRVDKNLTPEEIKELLKEDQESYERGKMTDNYVGPDKYNPKVQHRVDKNLTPEEIKELEKEQSYNSKPLKNDLRQSMYLTNEEKPLLGSTEEGNESE